MDKFVTSQENIMNRFITGQSNITSRMLEAQARADRRTEENHRFEMEKQRQHEEWQERQKKETGEKGRSQGSPDKGMVEASMARIVRDYPEFKDSSAAWDIASEAKAIMGTNRAISARQAIAQAYKDARDAGKFKTEEKKGFFSSTKTTKYDPEGGGKKPEPSAADKAAVEWAKSHPNDPRSKKILELNHG